MSLSFRIRRTLAVFALVAAVLFVVSLLRGRGIAGSLEYSAFWAAVSAAVFTVARVIQSRRGADCEVCQDAPEAAETA